MTRPTAAMATLAALAVTLALGACGVRPEDAPRSLSVDDIPFGLADQGRPPPPTTTSAPLPDRVNVTIFFLLRDRLQPVARSVPQPPSLVRALNLLLSGPTDEEAVAGLRSAINPSTQLTVSRPADHVVAVDLSSEFAAVPTAEQRLAIGQIVFTATGFDGVTGVRFTVAGAPIAVLLPDGTATSEPVGRDAFPALTPDTASGSQPA